TLSTNGTLVYLPGQGLSGAPIHWMDHEGKTTLLRTAPVNWLTLQFAPDGRRLALQLSGDIWIDEWMRDTLTRLTSDPGVNHTNPVWTPDGRRIVFASSAGKQEENNLYWQRADGVGDVQRLTHSPNVQLPSS